MGWFPLKMCEDKHSSNSRYLFYSFLVVIAWTYLQPHYDNGFLAMFTFQLDNTKTPLDKTNCWHPIAVMGVVDTFGHYLWSLPVGSSVFAIAIFWFDLNTVWTLLLGDLFSFVFWKKVKTQKRHFEINWPLVETLSCRKRWLICETNCVNRVQCGLVGVPLEKCQEEMWPSKET